MKQTMTLEQIAKIPPMVEGCVNLDHPESNKILQALSFGKHHTTWLTGKKTQLGTDLGRKRMYGVYLKRPVRPNASQRYGKGPING